MRNDFTNAFFGKTSEKLDVCQNQEIKDERKFLTKEWRWKLKEFRTAQIYKREIKEKITCLNIIIIKCK
jgi:hypothetical protein